MDATDASLTCDGQRVAVRPKTFNCLVYLVTHAGVLVTKDALLDAVWPQTAVGDSVLKRSIAELRKVLGETAQTPQFIATERRRGYRFIAPVMPATTGGSQSTPRAYPSAPTPSLSYSVPLPPSPVIPPAPLLVGRETEIDQLQQAWRMVQDGQRQIMLITGEAGLGKTSLMDKFISQLARQEAPWMARGQCIEQYGAGDAYLPLLEAIGNLST